MSKLTEILTELQSSETKLIAVSKTKPNEAIMSMYEEGQRVFGENRVQELVGKYEALPKDIEWHLIGHLQTNKVKYIASFVSLIHSVDSLKLLKEINKQGKKHNRVIRCLLQFHIAEESSKFGLNYEEASALLESETFKAMENVDIVGVMGMATFTYEVEQVRTEFSRLRSIFDELNKAYFHDKISFEEISMGMSGDYQLAIEEGSTMVRIGSLLFGSR